ncbi:bifunctional 4-hydroxy-2-oxoglutarate aldolase/2-dehydro-3-deoxy-phosphogluconate aldolase [Ferrimonas balearica]|uniref:bifunctional 4-hydroxy-2-oxoglutarate aldolase/2-dehydro-3-deoxy-phosphogluconate aldolase n=1 Tax=Ferrimonas balearica TaxID=44012 RepID=UPI001C99475B|nr:bifunctional 4-hydroxy-2-oxoglutarate aldolase/2-dehydro-3-deoxy-phosphogluconate aldolase [Ferrimonas balearica]MBY5991668.1 bifunctional 4-hydroxy-2-oxoglutarate aldolase/2-dehydro-3-deoxy-phosphogluconate aldolase [Ferrimonas balearica]
MSTSWLYSPSAIFGRSKVVPVMVIEKLEHAVPLAKALVAGGIEILEVTLRTDCAIEAIRAIREAVPEALVGAGTVITPEQLEAVIDAGAQFAISPGATKNLLQAGQEAPIALIPGVASVSDAMKALEQGYDHLKFFPAEASGGAKALKAMAGPLAGLTFCPTGGIGPGNYRDYLALGNVACVGGSWVAPSDAIESGDWDRITELSRQALAL